MKINDLPELLWSELGSTKERLKYLSGCCREYLNNSKEEPCLLVKHEDLDKLITATYELVLEMIEEHLGDTDAKIYVKILRTVVVNRFEKDFP